MRINPINNYNSVPLKPQSFGHTAVPYPEYEGCYYPQNNGSQKSDDSDRGILKIFHRLFFDPEVAKRTKEIKDKINRVFDERNTQSNDNDVDPKKAVYALA